MLDLNKAFKLNKNIVLRGISDKYWALNVDNGKQFRLNGVSYFIMNCFRNGCSVEEMIEAVLKEYRVEREILIKDCENVIEVAIRKDILEEVKS